MHSLQTLNRKVLSNQSHTTNLIGTTFSTKLSQVRINSLVMINSQACIVIDINNSSKQDKSWLVCRELFTSITTDRVFPQASKAIVDVPIILISEWELTDISLNGYLELKRENQVRKDLSLPSDEGDEDIFFKIKREFTRKTEGKALSKILVEVVSFRDQSKVYSIRVIYI